MNIIEKNIGYYINRLKNKEYFSFPGFGDSEWNCILGKRIGEKSGLGQIHTLEIGERLRGALVERENYLRATAKVIMTLPIGEEVKKYGGDFYERDMVTDDLAAEFGGLRDFIQQLRRMNVYVVSNSSLRGLFFLNYKKFFEITMPNYHLVEGGIDKTVKEVLDFGESGVYLFSCGVSAPVMISELHGKIPDTFLIDCGSIWDCFVGVGGQRQWRADLYTEPEKWSDWVKANLRSL